jgi:hypothetical protein
LINVNINEEAAAANAGLAFRESHVSSAVGMQCVHMNYSKGLEAASWCEISITHPVSGEI